MPDGDLRPATRPAEDAPDTSTPPSTRRKRKRTAHLPLLSRESRDTFADADVNMVEGVLEDHRNASNAVRQASTSDTKKLGANAGFTEVRNLYDQQDKVMKLLAHLYLPNLSALRLVIYLVIYSTSSIFRQPWALDSQHFGSAELSVSTAQHFSISIQ